MIGGTDGLDAALRATGNDIDVRYGLVGYGQIVDSNDDREPAHVHLVSGAAFSAGTDHVQDIQDAIDTLAGSNSTNQREDGWDAIEAAIAEYPFRDGAVPVLVVLQTEGRTITNTTLLREGILNALESKNVLVNTMIPGVAGGGEFQRLFDLAKYDANLADEWVLGVEADRSGAASDPTQNDDAIDGRHNYILIDESDGSLITERSTTESDALQVSFDGSNTGVNGMVATGKSIPNIPFLAA
jgi:hypothetical protein